MPELHYHISPSQLHRWLACDASYQEEQKYPEQPSGDAAIDGTHTHTLIERCIKEDLKDAIMYLGETLKDHEGEFEVDLDRVKRANVMMNYVKQRKAEIGVCAIRAEELCDPGKTLGWDDWKGTADCTLVGNEVLEVIDYKDGRSPQDVVNNPQLLSYLLGRVLEYPDVAFPSLRMTIVQPRCNPPISHHDLTGDELFDFVEKVKAWRERATGESPTFTPGEKQCKWCRAKGGCKALQEQALGGAAMSFQNIEVAQQAADKEPGTMSDEQLKEFIEAIPLLKQAIVAAEEEALRRFKAGHTVPGLKAVRGRGSRGWAFSEDEMAEKLKRMGIPKPALFVTKLVSPAQVEKLHWEKRDGTKHTLSKRQLETLKKDYIKWSEGKISIVPESDDRDAVSLGAEQMFGTVESEPSLPEWLL